VIPGRQLAIRRRDRLVHRPEHDFARRELVFAAVDRVSAAEEFVIAGRYCVCAPADREISASDRIPSSLGDEMSRAD